MRCNCFDHKTTLTGILFLFQLACTSQNSLNNFNRNHTYILELKYRPENKIALPVNSIEVLDARFDQSRIGIKTIFNDKSFQQQDVIFPDSFTGYLQPVMNSWFLPDSSSPDKLVLLLKNFRVTENISDLLMKGKNKEVFFQLVAAVYLQRNDKCYKVGLINKWFNNYDSRINNIKISNNEHETLVTNVLINQLRNTKFSIDPDSKAYSRNEIEEAIRSRFNVPILHEKPKKGVFITFDDFLQNQPSYTTFERVEYKNSLGVLVDSAGKRINFKSAWGFSNGEQVFYFLGENFYELKKRSGLYELKAYQKIDEKLTLSLIDELFSRAYIPNNIRRTFKLENMPAYVDMDMDTGELYLQEIIGMRKGKPH